MFIKKILEHSDDIVASDGKYDLLCMCYTANTPTVGADIKNISAMLSVENSLFSSNVMRVDEQEYLVEKQSSYYAYHLQGKVMNIQKGLICIGNLVVDLGISLPKDIKQGEFVEFTVDRLDCYI